MWNYLLLASLFGYIGAISIRRFFFQSHDYLMVVKNDGAQKVNLTIYQTKWKSGRRYLITEKGKTVSVPDGLTYKIDAEALAKIWGHGKNKYEQITLESEDYIIFQNEILEGEKKDEHILKELNDRKVRMIANAQFRIAEGNVVYGDGADLKELAKTMATDIEFELLNYLYSLIHAGLTCSDAILMSFSQPVRNTYLLANNNRLGRQLRKIAA
ncbi:hypothetical protein LCGC14_0303570 [marine sediment metagenome]|uniref:Uncharacterized protein n=1 Tax=marine sediment metagenome TaxID=412755 RepID=A0A0F9WBD1_9ZZZZ